MKKNTSAFSTGAFLSWFIDWAVNDKKKKNKWLVIKNWHIHHSVFGLLIAATSGLVPFILGEKVKQHRKSIQELLLSLGLGVVAEHTASEGFKFIEKETESDKQKRLGVKHD